MMDADAAMDLVVQTDFPVRCIGVAGELHPVHAQVGMPPAGPVGVLGIDLRQRDERPPVARPRLQLRQPVERRRRRQDRPARDPPRQQVQRRCQGAPIPPGMPGDLGRIVRDQEFLRVLGHATASRGIGNPLTDNALLGSIAPQLTVDQHFSFHDLVNLALTYHGVDISKVPEQTLPVPQDDAAALALTRGVLALGLARLPWTKALKQRRDRVMFLRRAEGEAWPDLSDEALAADPGWLAPFLTGKTKLDEIGADDLAGALDAALPWDLSRRLTDEAPTHFQAPTGTAAPIDYEAEGGPAIALRVQELFGLSEHPTLAGGRIPLTLHLLSPANRPIQITRDLPGFWRGSWAAVRSDLRGRYPRHFWPEDPAAAQPTARAKPRGA